MINRIPDAEYTKLEIIIARLYVYLLPIRMIAPLNFLSGIIPGAVVYTDFWLHAFGMLLMIKRNNMRVSVGDSQSSKLAYFSFVLACVLNLSSFVMAIVMQLTYGNIGNDNAFKGIAGMVIYFFQYSLMFIYNREVFRILGIKQILKTLRRICWGLLALGYLQVFAMNFGGIFVKIHDTLDVFDVLYSAARMPKLCLTGSEGASAGGLIAMFVMPVLYGSYISERKIKYLLQVFMWLVPLYFTNSSTAYICFVACSLVFLLFIVAEQKLTLGMIVTAVLLIFLVLVVVLMPEVLSVLPDSVSNQVRYLLTEKATDLENGSTVSRTIPLIINWNAFLEYPLLGVGNGLQGYFYEKYFPSWALKIAGSDVSVFLERSKTGIGNAGAFIPGLLSGYGVVGCCLIAVFVIKLVRLVIVNKKELSVLYYVFFLSIATIVVNGFQGDFYGRYYLWFILSIPLMNDYIPVNTVPKSKYIKC